MSGNVQKTAFGGGPISSDMPSYNEPGGAGQSSGKVRHNRSGQKIENLNDMPKGKKS